MLKILVALSFILLTPLAYGQAGKPPGQAAGKVANPEGAEAGEVEDGQAKISEIQTFLQPFSYDREELRDPFETQGSATPLKPGQVYGPFLPLQTYRLAQFKLKGLMWSTKNPVAVFIDPDGTEHRLKIKEYIGENFGYVASIREKEVVVIQTIEENERRYSTTKIVFLE